MFAAWIFFFKYHKVRFERPNVSFELQSSSFKPPLLLLRPPALPSGKRRLAAPSPSAEAFVYLLHWPVSFSFLQLHVHLRGLFGSPSKRRAGLHAAVLPGFLKPRLLLCCWAGRSLPVGGRQMRPLGVDTTSSECSCSFLPFTTRCVNPQIIPFSSLSHCCVFSLI